MKLFVLGSLFDWSRNTGDVCSSCLEFIYTCNLGLSCSVAIVYFPRTLASHFCFQENLITYQK